ncbi:TPA: hypothetical protein H2S96_004370 [Salmonella enterica]|nr:hypothetical protein [Salmonella enterica]
MERFILQGMNGGKPVFQPANEGRYASHIQIGHPESSQLADPWPWRYATLSITLSLSSVVLPVMVPKKLSIHHR